ncbi:hypothetical protein ACPOL_4447 [Acidisarcina polymorpha]|uniref:Uncharacterized protein n=1 Tax=Acidisarcina polymorpha TaxID=2211140 RepID=A0A2Z5G3W6_9BACT|nr:hypothetical protein ACPOL_4447 [Acidisarcina polymorpha]
MTGLWIGISALPAETIRSPFEADGARLLRRSAAAPPSDPPSAQGQSQ